MSAYTLFRVMIFTFVLNQSLSTQNSSGIISDQPEVTAFSMTENITPNATITHVAYNGTGNFSSVDSELMNGLSFGESSVQQIFKQVRYSLQKYLIFTINIFSFFSCIITIVVLQRGALRSSSTVYIRGMAISSVFITLLYFIYTVKYHESVSESRSFQNFYSYIVAYGDVSFYIGMAANVWIILAFAVERTFAIWLPLKARVFNNESRAKKIVAVIFLVAILVNIPRFLRVTVTTSVDPLTNDTLHVYVYTSFGMDPFIRKAMYISFAVIVIIIPMPILAILNVLIIIKLRSQSRNQLQLREGDAKAASGPRDKKQVQTERVLVASLLSFFICYTPIATTNLSMAFEGLKILRVFNLAYRLLFLVGALLFVFNPFLNFIMYVVFSKILRDAVKDLFCSKCVKNKAGSDHKKSSNHTQRTEAK